MADSNLTPARLHEVLSYDSETGIFTRKLATSTRVKVGETAGSLSAGGYINIKIDKVLFLAHRLAWLYVYGVWPNNRLDHINGRLTDNRISNIREATSSENQQNCKVRKDSFSGFTGVSFHKLCNKWQAYISVNGSTKYLGVFETPELADMAYKKAKMELHKFQPIQRLV